MENDYMDINSIFHIIKPAGNLQEIRCFPEIPGSIGSPRYLSQSYASLHPLHRSGLDAGRLSTGRLLRWEFFLWNFGNCWDVGMFISN